MEFFFFKSFLFLFLFIRRKAFESVNKKTHTLTLMTIITVIIVEWESDGRRLFFFVFFFHCYCVPDLRAHKTQQVERGVCVHVGLQGGGTGVTGCRASAGRPWPIRASCTVRPPGLSEQAVCTKAPFALAELLC